MKALFLALALLAPPGVHYQGTQGTGAVQWTPPASPDPVRTWVDFAYSPSAATATVTASSIPAGALVVAYAALAERAGGSITSVGSPNLTWSVRATQSSTNTVSEIWTAVNSGGTLTNEVITLTASGTNRVPGIGAWVITNADIATLTQDNVGTGTGASGSISVTASATATHVGGFVIYTQTTATAGSGNTTDEAASDGGGYGFWTGHRTAYASGAQSVAAAWSSAEWTGAAIAINGAQ